jgi:glycosyltransferase involved in cell wall biosynthesis
MRILFALPGLHKVHRGAEVVFESIAHQLAAHGKHEVTLVGAGREIPGRSYRFEHVGAVPREHFEGWPTVPLLRSEYMYEELTFAAGLALRRRRQEVDVTVTCGYPYTNWALRSHLPGRRRPPHVFVTQNGDWPAHQRRREYRLFSCDGLICTNPEYLARNQARWFSTLIPNGFDPGKFHPGPADRAALGLPTDRPLVLIASALVPVKRVLEGIRAVAGTPGACLLVAGDGPLRDEVDRLGAELLPGRFLRRSFTHAQMPDVYRAADVFLHMALGESFGNVYVEALASGTPVVAHDHPVTRWILEDQGRLVDATSQPAVAAALASALDAGREGAAERAAFAASRYTWQIVASRYLDFFSEVAGRARPGA